jgi:hypothetical protein
MQKCEGEKREAEELSKQRIFTVCIIYPVFLGSKKYESKDGSEIWHLGGS